MKFVRKSREIEARQFVAEKLSNMEALAEWCGGKLRGYQLPLNQMCIQINTPVGELEANPTDWITKGPDGVFYPCTAELFNMLYEPVDKKVNIKEDDKKPIFMLGVAKDGMPILIFAVPETAYNPAPNSWSFNFDLSPVGFPIRASIVKTKNYDDSIEQITKTAEMLGIPIVDHRTKTN